MNSYRLPMKKGPEGDENVENNHKVEIKTSRYNEDQNLSALRRRTGREIYDAEYRGRRN